MKGYIQGRLNFFLDLNMLQEYVTKINIIAIASVSSDGASILFAVKIDKKIKEGKIYKYFITLCYLTKFCT